MAAVRTADRGLTLADLEVIRDTLASGRKPKVMFTEAAGQIAGQVGQVVQLADPAEGDEYVVVRFGGDELPFSPTDLAIPPRGAGARKAVPAPKEAAVKETAVKEASVAASVPDVAAPPGPELRLTPPPAPVPGEEPAGPQPPARRAAARAAKPKPPAALTVTLSYSEGEWTVGATQGTKALAKPYVIKPAEALKMVGLLDVPGVHEAVEQIVSAERAVAQEQAERLRSQLAEVEAKLAELGDLS
jgi:hypothetical protein